MLNATNSSQAMFSNESLYNSAHDIHRASQGFHRQWHYSRERRLFCPQWMGTVSYALHLLQHQPKKKCAQMVRWYSWNRQNGLG